MHLSLFSHPLSVFLFRLTWRLHTDNMVNRAPGNL
jgi:hypothetical protein